MRGILLKNKRNFCILFLLFFVMGIIFTGCSVESGPVENGQPEDQSGYKLPQAKSPTISSGLLEADFIDVGQADSIFIRFPEGKTMLIDAGNNDDGEKIVSYIKKQGVKKLDVVVGTHPHEDHIGGMDDVIDTFDIGKIYMPKVTTTTRTFKDVLTSIAKKNLKITSARASMTIPVEDDVKVELLAPNSTHYEDLNNYSIVLKVIYKDTSFLFAGDAEKLSEEEMLKQGFNLRADVLKVGHHGSNSGTSESFLSAVVPRYAIISVGKNNDYGHPHKETLKRLAAHGVKVYTTADNGNILVKSDGKNIKISILR